MRLGVGARAGHTGLAATLDVPSLLMESSWHPARLTD